MLIATAVAATLSYVPAGAMAAGADDLAQIREQLQTLMQRVDKLEQENNELKGENESLKSQTDYLKAETKGLRKDAATTAVDVGKVKGADWASRVAITGDFRYRNENIVDDAVNAAGAQNTADRHRDRIRARINTTVKATDTITVGFGFTTTEGSDPRSGNQTLTNVFSRKALDLDTAYFDWKYASWGDLIGGKMKQPFFKPGQSLFWDNDINPEGLAATFNSGMFFGSGYYYWLSEISGAESVTTSDPMLYGAQVGFKLPIGASSLTLAAHYYDLRSGQFRSPFYVASPTAAVPVPASAANGNTTTNIVTGTSPNTVSTAILVNDYNVANLSAQFDSMLGALPFQLWADYAQNTEADDLDTAWAAG
ncbi:MAG: putative porin, partial [Povalibacter sp.]